MSKLGEKIISLTASIEKSKAELESMPKFDSSLWRADELLEEGVISYVVITILSMLVVYPISILIFGWIFGLFTPFPFEYGGAVIPIIFLWQSGKTYLKITSTNPFIFERINFLKNSIKQETLELQIASADLAKSKSKALEIERKFAQKLPEYWNNLKGVKLEVAVAKLFTDLGHSAQITKGSGDGGIDLVLIKDGKNLLIQCKGWAKPVGSPTIRDMAGVASAHNSYGVVISPNGFTKDAKLFGQKSGVRLWDSNDLVKMANGEFP